MRDPKAPTPKLVVPVEARSTKSCFTPTMAPSTQKPNGDTPQAVPAFSYAQAAKGRPPAVPSPISNGKASSEATEADGKRRPSTEVVNTQEETRRASGSDTVTDSDAQQTNGANLKANDEQTQVVSSEDLGKVESDSAETAATGQIQPSSTNPPTPEYGTASTSTLPKEDDTFSAVNGSSDATSDKLSQTSANGAKSIEKPDSEKEQTTAATWEEEATVSPPTMKEAPPPQVNVWKLRSDAAKRQTPGPAQPPKLTTVTNGISSTASISKSNEPLAEQKREDSKKKFKPGQGDDRAASGIRRDNGRITEGASRNVSGTMAPPPPPGDAFSWPTPDNVASDAKKTNQDRPDKADKESPQTPKPHGKEKWVAVPFVPTAVFNTPLPQGRRGGRGGTRGGREGDSRGRNNPGVNGGIGEKPAVAGANNAPSMTNGQDRGKAVPNLTGHANNSKPKRASSAGPAPNREQRKVSEPSIPERKKDEDAILPKSNQSNSNTSRRPSATTVSKDSQNGRPFANAEGGDPSWSRNVVADGDQAIKKPAADLSNAKDLPRPNAPERRSDSNIRPMDSVRDFSNNGHRERGEPRPERGRGGYRGRGTASHPFNNPNVVNGHGYSNGYGPQHQYGAASPSKPQSNHDRFPAPPQASYQQSHHQPRHYRANSRSQSIPHSTPYGRFSNSTHGGPPHLANLHTDLANEFGYIPANQGAMTAIPLNSYPDQHHSVFGMVSLQM